MGNAASQKKLCYFYLPELLITSTLLYLLARNNPNLLPANAPLPAQLKAWYKLQPVTFALVVSFLITIVTMLVRQDIQLASDKGMYYASLLPSEYYGHEPSRQIRGDMGQMA